MNKWVELKFKPTARQIEAAIALEPEIGYGGALGGGKSFLLCVEAFTLACEYPGNRIFMGRKVAKHFKATTLQTFYNIIPSNLFVENKQDQTIKIKVGTAYSIIQYGGLNTREDIDQFTSAEYGAILIDQAEELTESDFTALLPRLRLKLADGTSPYYRAIFTANPRACAFRERFIMHPKPGIQKFVQALPCDNPYLPKDYIPRLKEIYGNRPELLAAMVEGSWDLIEGSDIVIKYSWADKGRSIVDPRFWGNKCGVSVDPARFGDDESVIYGWVGTKIIKQDIFGQKDLNIVAARAVAMCREIRGNWIAVGACGLGAGVIDICKSLVNEKEIAIIEVNEASQAENVNKFYNKRAEMYWEAGEYFGADGVSIPDDKVLVGQLSSMKYTYSTGRLLIQDKEEIKKDIGRSPDRADACVIGLWALKRAPDVGWRESEQETSTQKWVRRRRMEMEGLAEGYYDLGNESQETVDVYGNRI